MIISTMPKAAKKMRFKSQGSGFTEMPPEQPRLLERARAVKKGSAEFNKLHSEYHGTLKPTDACELCHS